MPVRNSLPPVSYVDLRENSWNGDAIYTRYTVENIAGAWPGDNQKNCAQGYNCGEPTLLTMDRYGRPRWVDVGSGGPSNVSWTATPNSDWLKVSTASGTLTPDGKADARVWLSVDWDAVPDGTDNGTVHFVASDGATVNVTVPLNHTTPPPEGWHGAIQGDGYVAIEAGAHQALTAAGEHAWAEIPFYGRTVSGLSVFPVSSNVFEAGKGPSARYDFWATTTGPVNVTLHLGPALNYVLGKRLTLAVQVDGGEVTTIQPVPEAKLGSLPADWNGVVANEVRKVSFNATIDATGAHSVTVYGVTAGIVLERIIVDFGGDKARGYSYLGPPASVTQ